MMTTDYTRLEADWQRIFREAQPNGDMAGVLVQQAQLAARDYRREGSAYVTLAPGTGWEFKTVLHDLYLLRAQSLAYDTDLDPLDPEVTDPLRERVSSIVPFGGELLVAWPEWHKSLVLNHGLHTPDYLREKTELDFMHTIPLAVFLTAFSDAVEAERV